MEEGSHFLISTISLLLLTSISSVIYFYAKKLKLPYTLFLVFVGIVLAVLTVLLKPLSFITSFKLTPDVLFYVFLPTLLFEAAYNIKISYFINLLRPIFLLAVFGLIVSAFVTGFLLQMVLSLFGINIPFEVALLFGAIISATDPVAVIALFKEYAAPKRLTILFEGESLFNDGTAVALFLVVLSVIEANLKITNANVALDGALSFLSMLFVGIVLGILFGIVFSKLIHALNDNKAQITLFLVAAHLSFALSELLNEHVLPVSAIVATATTGIIIGNYGRYKLTPEIESYISRFWDYFAFLANSLVFILLGFLILKIDFTNKMLMFSAVIAILVVMFARALSVYLSLSFVDKKDVPESWRRLLSWGSLRGALAIVMVLLIPDSLHAHGWEMDISVKEFIMSLVLISIYFTLFIKGLTISPIMKKLGIARFGHFEKMSYLEAKDLAYKDIISDLKEKIASTKDNYYKNKLNKVKDLQKKIDEELKNFIQKNKKTLYKTLLNYAIGIEKNILEELYERKEVTEGAYKKFINKLEEQEAMLEAGFSEIKSFDNIKAKDVIEYAFLGLNKLFMPQSYHFSDLDRYTYYYALKKTAEEVINAFENMAKNIPAIKEVKEFERIKKKYERFFASADKKMQDFAEENPDIVMEFKKCVKDTLICSEEKRLQKMTKHNLISHKIEAIIKDEISKEIKDIIDNN